MEFVNAKTSGDTPINLFNNDYDSSYLLILEESQYSLTQSENDKYVFEGIAAELDVVNENNRIYTKEEYLKHLPYLQEKIRRGRLFGEIDHPQDYYEVKLRNMSHRIEDLWYDEETNTIRIKIRLLVGLDGGNFAKQLVDLGIPLAISSRAIGKVIDNKPHILRIFTFDLVAEPGFKSAILNKVNENANYDLNIKTDDLTLITESINSLQTSSILNHCSIYDNSCKDLKYNNNLHIYKINDSKVINKLHNIFESDNQNNTMDMTQQEFNKFTQNTQKELNSLKSAILKINEGLEGIQSQLETNVQEPAQADNLQMQDSAQAQDGAQAQMQEQAQETTELPNITKDDDSEDALKKINMYLDFMSKQLTTKEAEYQELQENVNAINNIMPVIGKALNKIINHENLLTKKVNESLNYVDGELLNTINETANTTNIQSFLISKLIEMSDNLSEDTSNIYESAEEMNSVIKAHGGFMNMLAKKINENEFELDNVTQSEEGIDATETQDVSQSEEGVDATETQDVSQSEEGVDATETTTINESVDSNVNKIDNLFQTIQNSAQKVLTKIENNKVDKILESQYPFLKLLDGKNKKRFYNLDNNVKKEIVIALNEGVYFNQNDVMSIVESVVNAQNANVPNHIKFMPTEFKPLYENLSPEQKQEIDMVAKSGFYKLNTPYQVKSFWHSIDINESVKNYENNKTIDKYQNGENLNESANANVNANNKQIITSNNQFIYDMSYVENI